MEDVTLFPMDPFYQDQRVAIYVGDCIDAIRGLPDGSVDCAVTSPPYWGLRDYGVGGQLGLEKTPEEYVANMVAVFREVRRVLKEDGTLWLNLGDSYASGNGVKHQSPQRDNSGGLSSNRIKTRGLQEWSNGASFKAIEKHFGVKPKDLVGIPWRVAFALQADGWYLRQDIIWHKPNPMPESVRDRCTKAHEYIFLLAKASRYYFDSEAMKEPFADKRQGNPGKYKWKYGECTSKGKGEKSLLKEDGTVLGWNMDGKAIGRNRRSVWKVTTRPYKGAHFAVYPPELIRPCVKAGCRPGGTVLDPFAGSGTTAQVAIEEGRKAILVELNPAYATLAIERIGKISVN